DYVGKVGEHPGSLPRSGRRVASTLPPHLNRKPLQSAKFVAEARPRRRASGCQKAKVKRQKKETRAALSYVFTFCLLPFYFCLRCTPSLTVGLPPQLLLITNLDEREAVRGRSGEGVRALAGLNRTAYGVRVRLAAPGGEERARNRAHHVAQE